MKPTLVPGIKGEWRWRVAARHLVPALYPEFESFKGMPPVFATGFLVGFVEWACIETMKPHLDAGEGSVGTHIDITHEAATPEGMEIVARVECVEVKGRKVKWVFEARDEQDVIARGRHERSVIDVRRFVDAALRKQKNAQQKSEST